MFLAIDLETSGLIPKEDRILQVAWTFLQNDLTDFEDYSFFRHSQMVDVSKATLKRIEDNLPVLEMHSKTGLWYALQDPSATRFVLSDIEDTIMQEIESIDPLMQEPVYLLGASVHFDRSFIDRWMPRLAKLLHHRILDTSSLKLLAASAGKEFPVENPYPHDPWFDILESIDIARAAQRYFTGDRVLDA